MSKTNRLPVLLIPSATVFFSSACIMVLEIVAGRLVARHLGSSLYTWTSVIGVVLAGITLGNVLGGRIADRFPAGKALAVLFGLCSVACVITIVSNHLVGQWLFLWQFGLPVRVFSHVTLVFLLPSLLLGTISPVVAKMALDQGLATGRTVGTIYAWGAAGSIVGTFLAGYFLIALMGTHAIIWTISGALVLMAVPYWIRFQPLYLWAAVLAALMTMGMAPAKWAGIAGSHLALREPSDPDIVYEKESQYCYIAVKRVPGSPDDRLFVQDNVQVNSRIRMTAMKDLQLPYTRFYAALTHRLSRDKATLSALAIGGGGYVFPRYIETHWPGSRVDVAEIDPGVTAAAIEAFGLKRQTGITTINMDARNHIDELISKKPEGASMATYDFIYGDAFNDYAVPYQLTTKEFNDKIACMLKEDGAYLVNVIDACYRSRFLGVYINTLRQTFPEVRILSEEGMRTRCGNFVVVASMKEIDLEGIKQENLLDDLDVWVLDSSDIAALVDDAQGLVLTDDYAPVENLMAPVAMETSRISLASEYLDQAESFRKEGKWRQSISRYRDAIDTAPAVSMTAHYGIVGILLQQGRLAEAVQAGEKALEQNALAEVRQDMTDMHFILGSTLKRLSRNEEAMGHLRQAVDGYLEALNSKPDSIILITRLGGALLKCDDGARAAERFEQAIALNPSDATNYSNLAQALAMQGKNREAVKRLNEGIRYLTEQGQGADTSKLESLLRDLEKNQR